MAGIWDAITGTNPNQGQINSANQASSQATAAENQLIQSSLLPAYQQLMQNYTQNYAPLQGGLGSSMSSILGGTNPAMNTALGVFGNEATQGLSNQTIGSALNTQQNQTQSNINSLMNSIGAASPNPAGLAQNLMQEGQQGLVNTESNLAGMNQAFQQSGASNLAGLTSSNLQQIMQYIQQGLGSLEGGTQGISGITGLYGNSANQAAQNAMNLSNEGNQMNASTLSGLMSLAGAGLGGGFSSLGNLFGSGGGTSALSGIPSYESLNSSQLGAFAPQYTP
jgi:hypothetical protein